MTAEAIIPQSEVGGLRLLHQRASELRKKVGIIFPRFAQPEVRSVPTLPDHIIDPFIRYADAYAAAYPTDRPKLTEAALHLEEKSHEYETSDAQTVDDIYIGEMLKPLKVSSSTPLFLMLRMAHPRRLSNEKVKQLKATFYIDLITSKLNPQSIHEGDEPASGTTNVKIDFNQLLASNLLFSVGRTDLITSNICGGAKEVNNLKITVRARRLLLHQWRKMSLKSELTLDQQATAQKFIAFHEIALEPFEEASLDGAGQAQVPGDEVDGGTETKY